MTMRFFFVFVVDEIALDFVFTTITFYLFDKNLESWTCHFQLIDSIDILLLLLLAIHNDDDIIRLRHHYHHHPLSKNNKQNILLHDIFFKENKQCFFPFSNNNDDAIIIFIINVYICKKKKYDFFLYFINEHRVNCFVFSSSQSIYQPKKGRKGDYYYKN